MSSGTSARRGTGHVPNGLWHALRDERLNHCATRLSAAACPP